MEFNQQEANQNSIVSIDNSQVNLSHATLKTPCFISPTYHQEIEALSIDQLDKALLFPLSVKDNIDLLIIGTGAQPTFLSPQQQLLFQQMGMGVECMTNESASRSFNLLLSDARLVGVLLL